MANPVPAGSARAAVQRMCTECEEEEKKPIQAKSAPPPNRSTTPDAGAAISAVGQGAAALPRETLAYFEPRFGHDFSGVRVHADEDAANGARAVHARAYTIGNDVVFGRGEYVPSTSEGRRLLAHELAHTLQQAGTAPQRKIQRREVCDEDGVCQTEPDATPDLNADQPSGQPDQSSGQPGGSSDASAVDQAQLDTQSGGSGDTSAAASTDDGTSTDNDVVSVEEDFQPPAGGERSDETGLPAIEMGDFPANDNPDQLPAAPAAGFRNGGRTGTVRWGDTPRGGEVVRPHAFTAGGMTGTTPMVELNWVESLLKWPSSAHGNEDAGSIQSRVNPTYQTKSNGILADSEAWIKDGTGTLDVTRSYTGVNSGNQGSGFYLTPAAAARINAHEVVHIDSTKAFYDSDLQPMLDRVRSYTKTPAGGYMVITRYLRLEAFRALLNAIGWADAISAFHDHDKDANEGGGSTDTAELATGTYPVDRGPGIVGGTNYQHRIKTPGEPDPT